MDGGPFLDWQIIPARAEAVIAERIQRLPESLQNILKLACIEGEQFTAEIVAKVENSDLQAVITSLSSELGKKHQIVHPVDIQMVEQQRLSKYRFNHILFQKYFYQALDFIERSNLHGIAGKTMEDLVGSQTELFAPQLAWHFTNSAEFQKAIHYQKLAGTRAVKLSAYEDAILHLIKVWRY